MITKRIVFTRADGGVSIVIPAHEHIDKVFGGDVDAMLAVEMANPKVVPLDATNVKVMEVGLIPADDTFRDAWTQASDAITVDLAKAREIQAARISHAVDLEIARLKSSEQKARLAGRTVAADADAFVRADLEVLARISQMNP